MLNAEDNQENIINYLLIKFREYKTFSE